MSQFMTPASSLPARTAGVGTLAHLNRRLLFAAATLIMVGATALALQAASPHVRALIAGEGTLLSGSE